MRLIPCNEQSVPHRKSGAMVGGEVIEIVHAPCQGGVHVTDDFSLKLVLRAEGMEGKGLPQSTGLDRDARGQDFDFFLAIAGWSACVMTGTDGDAGLGEVVDAHWVCSWRVSGMKQSSGQAREDRKVNRLRDQTGR